MNSIKKCKTSFLIFFILIVIYSCKESYNIDLPPFSLNQLVVEGVIVTNGRSFVNLSRTSALSERNIIYEDGASVFIESSDNNRYSLIGLDSGRYVSGFMNLNEKNEYRVFIKTKDNKEYVSDFSIPIKTPQIDSLPWQLYNGGVEIYVDARDPLNEVKYYRWEYEEDWEYISPYNKYAEIYIQHSPFLSARAGLYDSVRNTYDSSMKRCWKNRISSGILVGSSSKLSTNRMYFPIRYHPKSAWELSVLYSIHVKQYGLSQKGYEFFSKMKKNTESLGTIFDPLPSEITGNFVCINDTTEKVFGYVEATSVSEKRIYIDNKELPRDWNIHMECDNLVVPNISDSLIKYFYYGMYLPGIPIFFEGTSIIKEVIGHRPECVDCKIRGGTNDKPSFWPN